jgi:hypothetical protein
MDIKEFKDALRAVKRPKKDLQVKIHLESGDYDVTGFEYSKDENALKICAAGEERKQVFRISYLITKDHRTFAFDTVRRTLESEDDIILDIEEWEQKFLKECGIVGEISEKTGSTMVNEKEQKVVIDPKTGKAKIDEVEETHYYNCKILEVMKEIDDENDIYVRVWKNGNIG